MSSPLVIRRFHLWDKDMRRNLSTALAVIVLLALHTPSAQAASSPFLRRWQRDDGFVLLGEEQHAWTWGPRVLRSGVEPYAQSPEGRREVWYFDKGRMEISDPQRDPDDTWYITSGLLVRELISGEMQLGDDQYEMWEPAAIPVAGDLEASPPTTVTYADLHAIATIHGEAHAAERGPEQSPLSDVISAGGSITKDEHFARYDVPTGYYDPTTQHNIATVFTDALPTESLLYITGRPLTEPYWARVPVAHVEQDVLIQAFERRVLTYTPDNPSGWQVEWGNVGQQYAHWRYGTASDSMAPMVASAQGPRQLRELSPTAADIAKERRGYVGVAVYSLDDGALYSFQGPRAFAMYSTAKVPIMVAVLDRAVRENRRVTAREQRLISAMITTSDNNAATTLYADIGGAKAVNSYLRRIGINNTHMDPGSWGYSTTTAQDMARLMAKLGNCTILVERLCNYGVGVMQQVVRSQHWGVSAGVPDAASVALKNGWFPSTGGWGVNSIGLVRSGGKHYAIAAFTSPNPSMDYGIQTIERLSTEVYAALP
jgi:beta-lactamase class A